MNNTQVQHAQAQKGSALIFSLLILLVMTVVGLSSLSNTITEEKIAANHQDAVTAFQAAETANAQAIVKALPEDSAFFYNATKMLYDSTAEAPVNTSNLNDPTVGTAGGKTTDAAVTASSTLAAISKGPQPNSSYGTFIGYRMKFTGTGEVKATGAKAVNVQGAIKGPYPGEQQ